MSVEITNEAEFIFDFDVNELVTSVVERCLDYEKCPYESKVTVTFTDNKSIREINSTHRNIDKETDVLSFPMVEYEAPGDFSGLESDNSMYDCFDPDTGELILGDIVISAERAASQALEYGHTIKREIGFLVAHSMFHLFGYDHMEERERVLMEQKQREVLELLGIKR